MLFVLFIIFNLSDKKIAIRNESKNCLLIFPHENKNNKTVFNFLCIFLNNSEINLSNIKNIYLSNKNSKNKA